MILYLKDPKDSTKKFLDLMSTFSQVAGYKNQHTKRSVSFICINNEHAEKEIKKTIQSQ
jgi:hypothetical protein